MEAAGGGRGEGRGGVARRTRSTFEERHGNRQKRVAARLLCSFDGRKQRGGAHARPKIAHEGGVPDGSAGAEVADKPCPVLPPCQSRIGCSFRPELLSAPSLIGRGFNDRESWKSVVQRAGEIRVAPGSAVYDWASRVVRKTYKGW